MHQLELRFRLIQEQFLFRGEREEAGKSAEESKEKEDEACEEKEIILRPLNMEDMRKAKTQVQHLISF